MTNTTACLKPIPCLSEELVSGLMQETAVAVVFDTELNYLLVNKTACELLNQQPSTLIGKCILDLYPEITASKNHRNLMRAIAGETITDLIENRKGEYFSTSYRPFFNEGKVKYIVVKARKVA